MALPSPSSTFTGASPRRMFGGGSSSGTGVFKPQVSNGGHNTRYATLPLSKILSQREGAAGAKYADGNPVPKGMKINVPGYNTSGVGPGTRGYMGSWRPGGYNYGAGTGRPSARTSDEFYAQRDMTSGNPLDNLELGNSNLMGSFFKNAIAEARGAGGGQPGTAAPAPDAWAGRTTFGDGSGGMPAPGGAPTSPGATEPSSMEIAQMIADARRQETMDSMASYGTGSTGSATGGPGAIDGLPADLWFQYKANESGQPNQFAQPPGSEDNAWNLSHRLAPFLKSLGLGQPFPPRRPF